MARVRSDRGSGSRSTDDVGGRRGRRARRFGLTLVALVVALVGPVSAAQAHAFLVSSNPADGEVLGVAPTELRLQFSESVVLGATRIDLVDAAGVHLAVTGLRVVGQGDGTSTEDPVELVADLPELARSAYRISWETLSSDDLHATQGVLVFGVGEAVTAGGLNEPPAPPAESVLRWLILLGLAGGLGGPLAARVADRAGGPGAARAVGQARKVAALGAVVAAVAAAALLVVQLAASGADAGQLLWSSYGVRWGLRELGLLVLIGSAIGRSRRPARRTLLLTGALLTCVGTALLGHSGSGSTPDVTRVLASAAHLGAAAVWAGCLAILAVGLVSARRAGGDLDRRGSARSALRLFGPPAAVCVSVMVVTGVYLSSDVVGSVDAALYTIYGRTLLAKVALASVAGALALVNTVRLHGRGASSVPRRTVLAETVVAIGVLGLAAILTSGQPAMEPQLVRRAPVATSDVVDRMVGDLQEAVSVRPNRPGPNVVLVDVFDTRRPALAQVRGVDIVLVSADGVAGELLPAEQLLDGRWSVNTEIRVPGSMTVRVVVNRDGLPETTADFPWGVGDSPDQTRPAVVSTAPIGSILRAVALSLLVLAGLAWWLVLSAGARRRRGQLARVEPSSGAIDAPWAAARGQDEAVKDHVGATS